jgi:hypothetical protein
MVDFGVLSAVRELIISEKVGNSYGLLPKCVYIMEPEVAPSTWPAVFLELEESWTGKPGMGSVSFKISIFSNSSDGVEALDIANQIRQLVDGASFEVEPDYEATMRMNSSIVDIKKVVSAPRKVEQYYEAFVRRVIVAGNPSPPTASAP